MTGPAQLPLGVGLSDDATFANFHSRGNAPLLERLRGQLDVDGEPFLFLWGAPGSGRCVQMQGPACMQGGR